MTSVKSITLISSAAIITIIAFFIVEHTTIIPRETGTLNLVQSINKNNTDVSINASFAISDKVLLEKNLTSEHLITSEHKEKTWDPTFTIRRIANMYPNNQQTYFESCPDTASGRCYPDIPIGGGFWTLSVGIGPIEQPCKTNNHEMVLVNSVKERCPFFFRWVHDEKKSITADLEINNTDWKKSTTPNIWMGFNNVHMQGSNYVGENMSNDIDINNATTSVLLEGGNFSRGINDQNANARYVIGSTWFSPNLNRAITIEFNIGNILTTNGTIQDTWSSTHQIARDEYVESDNTEYVYLGGIAWGLPDISNANKFENVTIYWPDIVNKLVSKDILPPTILSENRPIVNYIGIEQHGRLHTLLNIKNYKMTELSKS